MFPSLVAEELRRTLTDFLGTTFALTDDDVRSELERFLLDPDRGIFRGPFVRVRLPFRPAAESWRESLEWAPAGFLPHEHQARAFTRLDSRAGRPQPTILTTGTGSGKTEAFLLPVLDHCRRELAAGRRDGIKAVVLYPMNALANDQARRIAGMVAQHPELAGLRVGLYTGDEGSVREMEPEHVIDHRDTLRASPPDILLTNYKMLDFLLLRPEDAGLWSTSTRSLRYLVLDEFHTYDGAQGTDVAMLLRRLGAALGVARPARPLGDLTPIATSATLGDSEAGEDGRAALLTFAAEVFGEQLDPGAVIGETRMSAAEWVAAQPDPGLPPVADDDSPVLGVALAAYGALRDLPHYGHDELASLAWALFTGQAEQWFSDPAFERPGPEVTGPRLRRHPLTRRILKSAARPIALDDLIDIVEPTWAGAGETGHEVARELLSGYLALLSEARLAGGEGPLLQVEVQVWVREVRRMLRQVSPSAGLSWESDTGLDAFDVHLPAVYCRHCGRSGWAALRPPAGQSLILTPATIWATSVVDQGRVVALIHASGEAAALHPDVMAGESPIQWFVPRTAELVGRAPEGDDDAVPVLHPGDKDDARKQRCPACELDDGIRFLGSRVATLASVILGHLFGSPYIEDAQKKTLMFTDSVQDAAHRAAFVEARAFVLNQRATIAAAIGSANGADELLTLDEVGDQLMARARAGSAENRYAILPPDLKQHSGFARFWSQPQAAADVRARVRARLQFGAAMEFGLNSRTGRSLELTGAVTAEIQTGQPRHLIRQIMAEVRALPDRQLALTQATKMWRPWIWGVLERMRTQGAVEHPWFDTYLNEDGNRWSIWGGRNRDEGMPAFPRGRPSPRYPVTSAPAGREAFDVITSTRGWYANWTKRCLGVSASDAPALMRVLLDTLARRGVLTQRSTASGATAWLIRADRIMLRATAPDTGNLPMLRCSACAQRLPGGPDLQGAMTGAPCLRDRCPGTYLRHRVGTDYYRTLYLSNAVRRIVAAEHTGLLDGDVRARLEAAFKQPVSPDAPNVLACTPTLELGIDIGDLSIVALTSLPRSTAAYLQRVGRAGRQTGSALIVSVLPSRPLELRRLADPLSLIAGDVVPPACHLDAAEILRRQYFAFLIDASARAGTTVPNQIAMILGAGLGPETWLGKLLLDVRPRVAELVEQFLALFGDRITAESAGELRAYAGAGGDGVPELEQTVRAACLQWIADRDERKRRIAALAEEAARLAALGDVVDDDTEHDRRRVRGELARARAADREARKEYWISGLESAGLLPNYALLDDRTTLDVALWWTDEESGKAEVAESQYARGSRVALRELAPGAVFYVRGSMLHIDAVDLGTPGNPATRQWRCCPSCGWSGPDTGPHPCPRCGNTRAADTGQQITVVPFRGASAYGLRDQALAADQHDERERTPFTVVTTVDVAPETVHSAWRLTDYPFGVEFSRRADIRWFNLGPEHVGGRTRDLAGWSGPAPLFHTCRFCGVVPAAQRGPSGARRTPQDARHRGWCSQRRDFDHDGWVDVALTHHLRTQALRLLVPPVVMADDTLLVSFRAALLLGLRSLLGGDPDHIDVTITVAGPPSAQRYVMVLHDLVPGGTGYLAQIAGPDHVQHLLQAALTTLQTCPCAHEGVAACHRCLLSHVPPHEADYARRDRALELLEALLDAWEPEAVASISEIAVSSHESPLELRFRAALRSWLESRSVSMTESADTGGDRWDFRLPAGTGSNDLSWTMRAQVPLGGCVPDFVLTAAGVPMPIAVFTDGLAFHNSIEHPRVADDAAKRRALRDAGYLVWALTHEDIDGFMAAEPSWDQLATIRPHSVGAQRWATHDQQARYLNLARKLVQQAGHGGSVAPEALSDDAMTLLVRVLQQPDLTAWRYAARAAAFALVGAGQFESSMTLDQASAAAGAAAGAPAELPPGPTSGRVKAAVRTSAHGAGLVFIRRAGKLPATDAVLALDDRLDVIGSPVQIDSWRDWLALSNALQLTGDGPLSFDAVAVTEFTGRPSAAPGPWASASVDRNADALASPVEAWLQRLLDDVDPICHPLVLRLTPEAARSAKPGYETDEGTPLEIAWPSDRIAVLLTRDDETDDWLAARGWTGVMASTDEEESVKVLAMAGLIAGPAPEDEGAPQ